MHIESGGTEQATADARARDERWAAWVAKGAADDKQTYYRRTGAAVVIGIGLVLWLAMRLFS